MLSFYWDVSKYIMNDNSTYVLSELNNDVSSISDEKVVLKIISDKLKQVSQNGGHYFSGDDSIGAFCKGAGKGMQGQLYNELVVDLGFVKPTKQNQADELL